MRSLPNLILTVLALALPTACSGSKAPADPPLAPPDGTGNLAIAMDGEWIVTEVEILEQVGGTAPAPTPPTRLFPPVVGSTLTFGPDGFLDLDGTDATTMCMPDQYNERFAHMNQHDGHFALLDIGCRSRPDPRIADGGSSRVQCAFGSVDERHMLGFIRVEVMAAPIPAHVPNHGLYRVALQRR